MRKYISILLLFVFLYNSGGYYLWFRILQYDIQEEISKEIRKGLKEKDLSLIVVPLNNESGLYWTEANEEFSYKGKMYDVVKTKVDNQNKYYYCINDSKEKQLIDSFIKTHSSKKDAEKIIKSSLDFKYFNKQFSFVNNLYASDFIYPAVDLIYKSNTVEVSSPPPNLV